LEGPKFWAGYATECVHSYSRSHCKIKAIQNEYLINNEIRTNWLTPMVKNSSNLSND